ncbi:MAG: hypothetical protein KGY80_11145 [Candidatus Thorarchaeota archaeon]|nr:hypothetical protein [Candidatus Thorarchaeota archaeon]
MKLFYKVDPQVYEEKMNEAKEEFGMHQEIDEEKTILMLDDTSKIERITGSYHPREDDEALVRIVLHEESLKDFFDHVFGEPFLVK